MTLNRLPEFKGFISQLVCVVEIQFESALVLIYIISGITCHGQWAPYFMHMMQLVLKQKISIFFCVFLCFKSRVAWGRSTLEHEATI